MGRIEELIDYCSQLRPNVPWAELREEAVRHPFVVEGPPERREPSSTGASATSGASAHRGASPAPPTAARQARDDVAPARHRRRGLVWVVVAAIAVALLAAFGWCAVSWTTCPWEAGTTDGGEASPEGQAKAPVQLLPPDGTEFRGDPKPITLQWRPVYTGEVSSYTVEIDCLGCCVEGEWCTEVNAFHIIQPNVEDTTFTLEQPGNLPLRWRVWTVDYAGVDHAKSDWWEFKYVP